LALDAWLNTVNTGSSAFDRTLPSPPSLLTAPLSPGESALMENFDMMPFEGEHHALLRVKALLRGRDPSAHHTPSCSGRDLHAAVCALRELPREQRKRCLGLFWVSSIPMEDAGNLTEGDVLQLLEWLEGATREGDGNALGLTTADVSMTRLALVRMLAAIHIRQHDGLTN